MILKTATMTDLKSRQTDAAQKELDERMIHPITDTTVETEEEATTETTANLMRTKNHLINKWYLNTGEQSK